MRRISTGSEVAVTLAAAEALANKGTAVRVVSMPSQELSRAYVLEDVCNLLTVLMGLAWRLRAWASLEQP